MDHTSEACPRCHGNHTILDTAGGALKYDKVSADDTQIASEAVDDKQTGEDGKPA